MTARFRFWEVEFGMVGIDRFTAPFSFVGCPAMSVPIRGDGPFPPGVQLVAAPGKDGYLLRAAAKLRDEGVVHG